LKLFRYYFLQIWREKNRHAIADKQEFRQELVESTMNLWDEVQANGIVLEDFGAKTYFLTFVPKQAELFGAPGLLNQLGGTPMSTP
jgi:hypothetical protein